MAIEFSCPMCSSTIRVPDAASGKKGTCPACHSKLKVPVVNMPGAAPPAPPVESAAGRTKSSSAKKASKATETDNKASAPAAAKRSRKEKSSEPAPFDPFLDALENPVHEDEETNTDLLAALEAPKKTYKSTAKPQAPTVSQSTTKPSARSAEPDEVPAAAATPVAEFAAQSDDGEDEFPFQFASDEDDDSPPAPSSPTLTKKLSQQRARSSGSWIGIAFFVICGFGLLGGVAWFAMQNDTTLGGDRVAQVMDRGTIMEPRSPDPTLIDASEEAIKTVVKLFKKFPSRIQTELIDCEFGVAGEELAVTIREGARAQFYRFPIDRELREFSKKNRKAMDQRRLAKLKPGLKNFFAKWDVGIRNREHPKEFAFRDDVGLSTCVGGLGYAISANVDGTIYPCAYEDEENLYFLLPRGTQFFEVLGRYGLESENPISNFPGKYRVMVKGGSKPKTLKSKKDDADADEAPTKSEGMMSEPSEEGEPAGGEGMMKGK